MGVATITSQDALQTLVMAAGEAHQSRNVGNCANIQKCHWFISLHLKQWCY